MKWVWLFGGIALFAVIFYALLGLWFWRRAKALILELEESERKLQAAYPADGELEADDEDGSAAAAGEVSREPAGDGQRRRPVPGPSAGNRAYHRSRTAD
ncbi:hypothetical protein [Actinopolymorpha sp. B9G3]|uniref:hypothetical protein n=1 Tax=Actinopolymorpha sp. B9G3 TaxID=3158970 RepID=UPI0032D92CE8